MERTREAKFLVKEPSGSTILSRNRIHLWFEVLESEDMGMRVRIPVDPTKYDDPELYKIVDSLEEGDIVLAVLERKSESDIWKPISIELVE